VDDESKGVLNGLSYVIYNFTMALTKTMRRQGRGVLVHEFVLVQVPCVRPYQGIKCLYPKISP
jgi:hypothetical protein